MDKNKKKIMYFINKSTINFIVINFGKNKV